ncbi:MAG TPA: helix-turn-helix transcriptional regulator [Epulopiscium sp.]|nr:helix-turn-helix transcriptional regulator [Candidatus Epulonipiscium sp.]
MKHWLNIKSKNAVTKFMISYSLVLLLPLIISMIGYQISFSIVEEGIKDTNLAMINQGRDSIDNELLALNSIIMQLSTDPQINSLTEARRRNEVGLYEEVTQSIKLLSNLSINSTISIIDRLYIYLRDTDYIITPETLYRADFYHKYILGKEEGNFEDWKSSLFDAFNYNKYVIHNTKVDNIQSIPFSHMKDPKGAVVVSVKKDKLTGFFSGLNESTDKGSYMYIQDKDGNLITSLSHDNKVPGYIDFTNIPNKEGFFKQKIHNQNMIVIHTVSKVNGWKYVLVMPNNVVMSKLITFKTTIISLFFVALIIGGLISYYMAYRNSKPLNRIVQELREFIGDDEEKSEDTYEKLGGAVSSLIINNKALASELTKQQPLIEAALLQKLIKGEFTNINEIKVVSESAGMNIMFKKLITVTFRIFAQNENNIIDSHTLQELNIARIVTKEALKRQIGDKVYFYDIDHLTSVAIIDIEGIIDLKKEVGAILEKSKAEILKEHGITPFFGISNECTNLLGMWRSYEESKTALNIALKTDTTNLMWYSNVHEVGKKYYYPLDFEQRMIKHTKAGESKNIAELIDILYQENFEKRQLENATVDKLYNEVISTIIKLTQPDTDLDMVEKLSSFVGKTGKDSAEAFFQNISTVFSEISAFFNSDTTSRHLKIIKNIKDYIQDTYPDPDLGLSMVATEFNLSEGYLSFFFKEQTGINFTDYVERLRISKACELLKTSTLTINEIGEKVGYNSAQSFRRAFKRIEETTPSAMRKSK